MGSATGVMVIVVRNGIGEMNSNSGRVCLLFISHKILGEKVCFFV